MANYFDQFDGSAQRTGNYFDQFDDQRTGIQPQKSSIARQIADVPIGLVGGVAGLINAGVGLADIVTGGKAGDLVDAAGNVADQVGLPAVARPTQWQNQIQSLYTPEMQASKTAAHQSAVDAEEQAKSQGAGALGQIGAGALGAIKGIVENPRAGLAFVTENYGGMKAIAKGTERVLARYLPEIDAAVKAGTMTQAQADARIADLAGKISPAGEGVLTMGQNAQQVREENPNASAGDYLLQVPAGIITGAIAHGVGRIPGLENAETTMALNALGRKSSITGDAARRAAKGVLSEGVLQEVPQSAQEQIWQNLATGKPWQEGIGEQAVQGLVAGGAMGGGAAGMSAFAKPTAIKPAAGGSQGTGDTQPPAAIPPTTGATPSNASSIADTVAAAVAAENAAPGQPAVTATPPAIATPAPTAPATEAIPQPPAAVAQPNTPAAPEPITTPVSTAAPTSQTNQSEPAGVPVPIDPKREKRAMLYDNMAAEREAIGTPESLLKAVEYRQTAANIRAGGAASPILKGVTPTDGNQTEIPVQTAQGQSPQPAAAAGVENKLAVTPATASDAVSLSRPEEKEPVAAFTNPDTKMTALIHPAKGGKFNVVLRDDDSGEYVQTARTGIPTLEKATAISKQMAGITAARETPAGRPKPSPIMQRDDLVGAIMRVTGGDGIAANMALTIAGDKAGAVTKLRGLFTNKGTSDLGDVAMHLRESEGYDVRDGEHLSELIRDASFGKVAVSMERQEREKEAAKELEYRDRIRAKAKKLGIKAVAVKFSDIDARVLAAEQARHDLAVEKLSERDRKRFEAAVKQLEGLVSDDEVRAILHDVDGRGMSGREKWKEALVLLRQFADDARSRELQGELDRAIPTTEEPGWFKDFDEPSDSADGHGSAPAADHAGDGGRESGQGIAEQSGHRERGVGGEVRPGNEGSGQGDREAAAGELELTGQTPAEVARQEADRVAVEKAKQAEAAQEAADKAATEKQSLADKIKARAENPDNFQFGEDAKAAAKPMGGLFEQSTPANPSSAESPKESKPNARMPAPFAPKTSIFELGKHKWRITVHRFWEVPVAESRDPDLLVWKAERGTEVTTGTGGYTTWEEVPSDNVPITIARKASAFFDSVSSAEKDRHGMALPSSMPAAQNPSAEQSSTKAEKAPALQSITIGQFKHTRTGLMQYAVAFREKVSPDVFAWARSIASKYKARWSAYKQGGAVPGFLFDDEAKARRFAKEIEDRSGVKAQEEPALADNQVKLANSPYIYTRHADGRWSWAVSSSQEAKPNFLGKDAPIIAEAESLLAERRGEKPQDKAAPVPAEKREGPKEGPPADDLGAMFDAAMDDVFGESPAPVPTVASGANPLAESSPKSGAATTMTPGQSSDSSVANQPQEGKFANNGDTLNDAERELRRLSHDREEKGDVALGNGKYVSFDDAVRLAREGIESGQIRPFPAQLNMLLDLSMRDVDRVLSAATADSLKSSETPAKHANTEDAGSELTYNRRNRLARAPSTRAPTTQGPAPARSPSAAAASAVENTGLALKDVANGLNALFKPRPGTLGSGPVFDEETYAAAKPYFIAGIRHFKQAGADIAEMMKSLIMALRDQFGMDRETISAMKPHVVRFMEDVKAGEVNLGEANDRGTESEGSKPLEKAPPAEVGGPGGRGPGGRGTDHGGDRGGKGHPPVDGRGGETGRSGGNRSATVHPAETGAKGENSGGKETGEGVPSDLRDTPGNIPEANFEIGDDVALGSGGQMTKYRDNAAAIKVLKTIEAERRRATADEQRILARYVGWGGIPNAFQNRVTGEIKADWAEQVAELQALLTPAELNAASSSSRNAHFTSKDVVDFMWQAAQRLGFNGGMVLEPSVGVGNFVGLMPREVAGKSFVTGIELDSLTSRMAAALYPRANIVNTGFQNAALPDRAFSLAIGNPPFGSESMRFQHRPELNGASIHNQFFLGSIDAVAPGGIMAMVVSRHLLDAQDSSTRQRLAQKAELVGAVRLPGSAFKGNALTDVVTDVLFFRRRDEESEIRISEALATIRLKVKAGDLSASARKGAAESLLRRTMDWTGTEKVKDPLGGEDMVVGSYFAKHPEMVVGTMDRSGTMRHKGNIDVKMAKGESLSDRLSAVLDRLPKVDPVDISEEALVRSEEMHQDLGESLLLSASGAEVGSIRFDSDGSLSKVVERIGDGGESALKKIPVSRETPWSPNLFMGLDGRWYRLVPKLKSDGTPVKNGKRNVYIKEVFKNESDVPAGMRLGESKFERIKSLIEIRDLLMQQINLEVGRSSHDAMEENRARLRDAYAAFVSKHGLISESKNASIVAEMPDEGLLLSLESGFKKEVTAAKAKATGMKASPARASKAAILTRPVAIPPVAADHAENAVDALAISMSETGRVSLKRISDLRGISEEEAATELTAGDSPLAFVDPEQGFDVVERNAYLSGNVRRKLEAAKQAALPANITALEAVQPKPWSSDKVRARIGANWIPTAVYAEFANKLLGSQAKVSYSELTNIFQVYGDHDTAAATATWGTKRIAFPDLMTAMLNSSRIAVYDTDTDGNRHFNQTETDAANDKKREVAEAFDEWIFKDSDRRKALTQLFNDKFNTRVNRQYDGSHLTFPGKVPDQIISLRRGQKNAVWRGIIEDAVLYDHAVGAGKTFTGIARAMERRRMGLSKKPMVVVPNHMVSEWAIQAYRLYPGARILAAGTADMSAKNRRRLFAKIASGDWDLVIVPHSSFQFIPVSRATEERFLNAELEIANAAMKEAEEDADPSSRFKPLSVKAAEALIKKIEDRLAKVRSKTGKDMLLTFEQMGVDDLSVDESHEFKNLFYSTRLTDVRGMGPASGSGKAFDLYTKMRVIREMNGSSVFMTGTPISNSAVEMYTIMRYLAPDFLADSNLEHFDAFRSQFVEALPKLEPTDSGVGLKMVTRLGREWSNMRALMEGYYTVADVVTNDDIKRWYAEDNPGKEFPLPKVKGGDRRVVAVQPTPTQLSILLNDIVPGFESLPNITNPKERNATRLRLMDQARKLSLHAKAVNPEMDDDPGGKLDKVVDEISAIYHKWTDDKGTQLVFLDRGVPKSRNDLTIIKEYDSLKERERAAVAAGDEDAFLEVTDLLEKFDPNEIEELRAAQNGGWSAYQHIKDGLIAKGIPANEIAFIQSFNNDSDKRQLFDAVNDGSVRVLIGSTPRMGAGTNVQERLVALHHVDATWKPSDIEQREGRIIRQGNSLLEKYGKDFEVEILAYVTERTVDAKLWDLNSMKLRMVNGIRYYDGQFEMDFDDEAAVGMAEIAAIASGDPLLLERFKLENEIDALLRQKRSHSRRIEASEDALSQARRVADGEKALLERYGEDAAFYDAARAVIDADVSARKITINGKEYGHADRSSALWEISQAAERLAEGEKLSIDINGKETTSKGAAEEAVTNALGDQESFVADVDGKHIIRRSDFARAMRDVLGHEFRESGETPIGTIAGIPVSISSEQGSLGYRFARITAAIPHSDGRPGEIDAWADVTPEKHKKGDPVLFTVINLRPAVTKFENLLSLKQGTRFGREHITKSAERARNDIPALEEALSEPFRHTKELEEKKTRLSAVENELNNRTAKDEAKAEAEYGDGESRYNAATDGHATTADRAIYGMVSEGHTAAEVLSFISDASRRPFNRYLANALRNLGVSSQITLDSMGGWQFNQSKQGAKYAAAYNPKTDTVALFTAREAERHILHELVHAATLKAIAKGGAAALQMRALFRYVQKSGALDGQYGMSNLDEFVAEVFSNPKFQHALKSVPSPHGSTLQNAWQWLVRLVSNLLGLKTSAYRTALDQAMTIGAQLMRENAALSMENSGDSVYSQAHGLPEGLPSPRTLDGAELQAIRRAAAGLERPKDGVFLRITEDGKAIATGSKGTRIPDTFRRFANDHGLTFYAGRNLPDYGRKPPGVLGMNMSTIPHPDPGFSRKTEPMPIAYRESGARYFGEIGGDTLDRTDRTRFNVDDTITVDGIERPRTNSKGKPIAQTDEGLRNFWRWFGDSAVADAQGRPLVVYHGTQSDFTEFDPGRAGQSFDDEDERGMLFSSKLIEPNMMAEREMGDGGNVIPAYLSLQNPLVVTFSAREAMRRFGVVSATSWYDNNKADILASATDDGHDGIIVMSPEHSGYQAAHTYVAFDPEQIKSATGNNGQFSPDNPDIRFNIASGGQQQPSAAPVAPGNLWQRAKAKAAAVLSPENLDKIIYELQDKFIDLRRLRDHIKAIGGTITDMNDAYLGEELYHKRLAYRTERFEKDELLPLMADLRAKGITTDELETFLHARHAPEANAEMAKRNPNQAEIDAGQIKAARMVRSLELRLQRAKARGLATVAVESALNEARGELANWNGAQAFQGTEAERRSLSGMSDAAAAAIMAALTPERRADLDALAARVDAINAGTLKLLDTYGLMSKESLKEWRDKYRYYIPLHRDEAHPDSVNHPIGQGFSTKGDAAKRRTGSNQKVTHILGHIAMQREAALTRGEKNHVMLKLYLMARQNPLPDVWKVGAVPTIDTIDKATGFVKSIPDPLYKTRPNVVMLRIAGKDVAITMNEHNPEALRMAQALKNLDVDDLHYLIPVVGKMTRWFAAMNTQYNPIFGVINLMRDTQEAALNLSTTELAGKQGEVLRDQLSILKEVLKNGGRMPKTGKWAALFSDFTEVGGTTGYRDLYLDAEARGKALLDTLQSLDRGKASQAAHAVADWLSDYNEAMENATRLAAYKAALDMGMSKERAASLAKNLTVNFNRKGRQTRELGALYAFFGAAVQGTARMAQTLAGPAGKKIMAGGVLLGAVNALMGIAMMGGGGDDDDEWDKIPDFVKQRSIIIPIGKQDYISIPMPLGFQFLPNIGRLAVEMAVYKDKTAGKQMAALFSVLADAFNPLGGNAPLMQVIAPTVMDPFVALAQNKDWTGKPIFMANRNSLDPQPGTKRAKDSATPWAKGLAEAINAITGGTEYTPGGWSPTPDQIDYVIGQLTGGVGREAGKVAATAAAPFTGEELPPYKIPLVGRLYGSTAGHSGQSERFYENITLANEAENEIKGRAKDGFNVAEYLRDNPGALELAARGNVAEKQVSLLRNMRHEEVKADRPDSVAKVRAINEQMAGVMRGFNREAARIGAQ